MLNLGHKLLESTSYPPQLILQSAIERSPIHQIIRNNNELKQKQISYRQCALQDVPKIKQLFQQWFPTRYDQNFYRMFTKQLHSIIAVINKNADAAQHEYIVGCIVWKIKQSGQFVHQSIWEKLFGQKSKQLYIVSLGVIDEFRGKGIAKQLIRMVKQKALQNKLIKSIFLHVAQYNTSAASFYEKMGFQFVKRYRYFYYIQQKFYGSCAYLMLVNGGNKNIKNCSKEIKRYS